ncbi:MAG: hypothetical protein HY927_11980 [Elusimicrobia bacterium]|nr:hypothetical protein [Elusimicrobiota bacterium]
MRKRTSKRFEQGRRAAGGNDRPLEFERGWSELEARHDQMRSDMMSLAAQLGVSMRMR